MTQHGNDLANGQPANAVPKRDFNAVRIPAEYTSRLPQLVFTLQETAWMLKVTPKTVRRLISRGLLKKSSAIRHLRITSKSIEEFLKNTAD